MKLQKTWYISQITVVRLFYKLLIEQLMKKYPQIHITVIVRGEPVINDATIEDAEMTGLADLVPVMGNGTKIAGTSLKDISDEARDLIRHAE